MTQLNNLVMLVVFFMWTTTTLCDENLYSSLGKRFECINSPSSPATQINQQFSSNFTCRTMTLPSSYHVRYMHFYLDEDSYKHLLIDPAPSASLQNICGVVATYERELSCVDLFCNSSNTDIGMMVANISHNRTLD